MVTRVDLTDEQRAAIEQASDLKVQHFEVKPRASLQLTPEQKQLVRSQIDEDVNSLELTEFDIKKTTRVKPYEAGLTVGVSPKGWS